MLAVQLGSEVGLRPMQALQNIAVINGRPAVWGDALPGLCKASPVYHDIIETWEHEQDLDQLTAPLCIAKRHGIVLTDPSDEGARFVKVEEEAHIAAVAVFDPEPAATLTAQLDHALSVARQDA